MSVLAIVGERSAGSASSSTLALSLCFVSWTRNLRNCARHPSFLLYWFAALLYWTHLHFWTYQCTEALLSYWLQRVGSSLQSINHLLWHVIRRMVLIHSSSYPHHPTWSVSSSHFNCSYQYWTNFWNYHLRSPGINPNLRRKCPGSWSTNTCLESCTWNRISQSLYCNFTNHSFHVRRRADHWFLYFKWGGNRSSSPVPPYIHSWALL